MPLGSNTSGHIFDTTFNTNGALYSAASGVVTSTTAGTTGQVLMGNTGSAPTFQAISGGGLTWSVITGASQAMSVNNGYIANRAGNIAFSLPTTSAVGDIIAVTGINTALGWTIGYTTNQQIFFGTSSATLTTGTLASTATRDTVYLVCVVADLNWNVVSSIGNITVT